jgi:hypothetical protein
MTAVTVERQIFYAADIERRSRAQFSKRARF